MSTAALQPTRAANPSVSNWVVGFHLSITLIGVATMLSLFLMGFLVMTYLKKENAKVLSQGIETLTINEIQNSTRILVGQLENTYQTDIKPSVCYFARVIPEVIRAGAKSEVEDELKKAGFSFAEVCGLFDFVEDLEKAVEWFEQVWNEIKNIWHKITNWFKHAL